MSTLSVQKIKEEIANKQAKWEAKDHPHLRLSEGEVKYHLGLRVDQEHLKRLRTQPPVNMTQILAEFQLYSKRVGAPSSFVDWRNYNGLNGVTPITDQGGCGSCVAFGTTATLESMVLVEHNVALDLS